MLKQIFHHIIILVSLTGGIASAQIDREFWFAPPDLTMGNQGEINGGSFRDRPILLVLSSINEPAQVKIWQPANLSFAPIIVDLGATDTRAVNLIQWIDQIETRVPDSIMNTGILIRSTAPITAYYELGATNNRDIIALKGKNANGKRFFTPFQTLWENARTLGGSPYIPQPRSGFVIVATDDTTNVTITPTVDILNHPAGVPFSILLHRGQTYYCEATGPTAAERPAGTKIESDKPIAVTMKDDMIDIDLRNEGGADLAADQLISEEKCGLKHIVVKGQLGSNADKVFAVAFYDSTYIYLNGGANPVDTLMAGQQYIYSFNGPAGFIRGSKKIALLHISGSTDQVAGAVIPSLECTGSNQVGFTRPGSGEFRLTLTIKNGFQNNFKLNGNPLDGSGFQPVPGTNGEWVYLNRVFTTAEVPTGKASLITNFSAELFHMGTAYRQGASCNYGYFSDFSYLNLGTNRSVCLSDSTILDAGPGKTKYLWSTGDTTQKIVVKTPGIYTVDVLSGNECAAKDTIEVSFYGPVVNIQQSRDTICEGTQLLLTVPGNYLFQWQDGVTTSSTYLASDSGLYWVEVTDYQGCKARDSARVYTAPRPTTPVATIVPFGPEISADTLCAGESLSLRMSNIEGASSYSWLQQTAQGSNIIPGQQLDLNNLKTTNSGTYLASVTINGCESLSDTLKILVNPTPEVNLLFTDTVCNSQTVTLDAGAGSGYTYEWQDGSSNQTFLASTKGLYWVEVENPEGCAKRDSVDLYFSVIPTAPEISISDVVANSDSLCAGEKLELSIPEKDQVSYFWITPGGSTVSPGKDLIIDAAVLQNSGKYYAFYSKDGCKSSLDSVDIFIAVSPEFSFGAADTSICGKDTLFLSAASGGDITYLWSDNSTDSLSGPITESGTWWVRLTNTIGCSVSDTVNVNFALLPKPEISISDVVTNSDSLCSGEKLMLSIPQQEEVTYSWTIPGGNTVNQGADFIVESVELQNSGKYYAFYTKSGCKSLIDSVDIVVGVSPVFSFNISDTSICGIDTIFLSAPSDPGLSYLWNDNSTDSLSGPITISGAWWVKITNSIGCSVTDTVKVDFRPLPDPVITGQTVVCIGDPLNLNVVPENGVKYFWKGPSFNSSDTSISVGNPQSGAIYSLWAENNGCYSKDTIEVTVILQPLPVVNLGQDVTICNGASLELTGPENVHRYFWSNGDTSRSTSFGPGQVVLTVRNIQGCSASDTLLISGSSPTAAFTSSPTGGALVNIPIAFTDQSTGNPVTWSWNFGNGQNATVQNPVNPFPVKGSYTVTLVITDSNGCTDTTSAVYVIEGEIAVPNSFTPNSDGKNDFFVVKGLEGFPDSDLKVFNRWGSEVFASNAYQNNWDGGDSPDGVYYYVLRLKNGQELKGDITLKRQ